MMQGRKPTTYKEWLNELNHSSKGLAMINAALTAASLNPNKDEARHDIALVLAGMYRREMALGKEHSMVIKHVDSKFESVAQRLFKNSFQAILNYIKQSEPEFDFRSTAQSQGKVPPGFIKAKPTYDKKGNERSPLGFVEPPSSVDENGNTLPGLGYLKTDGSTNGSLGFL